MGEASSGSCLCGWFQFPLCPHTQPQSTDFLTCNFFGLFGRWGLLPLQCGIRWKCPSGKITHAISGNWLCDWKRQPGFREVTSFSLDSPGRWRHATLVPGLNIGPVGNLLHEGLRTRSLLRYVHRWLKSVTNRVLIKLRGSWGGFLGSFLCPVRWPTSQSHSALCSFDFSLRFRMENVHTNDTKTTTVNWFFRVSDYFPFFFFFFKAQTGLKNPGC